MTTEEVIARILSEQQTVSREELLEKLETEKRKVGGLISDETLLRLIAKDFGLDLSQDETSAPALSLADLIPGLSSVSVVGRVIAVFAPKTFNTSRNGRIASLLIADKNDLLRVVLWNDKTSLIESGALKVGQIVRFSRGYTKEDKDGKIELHLSERSEIEADPEDVQPEDYATVSRFTTKIGKLTDKERNTRTNLAGAVGKIFPASAFTRQDSSPGRVMRFTLIDETGEIPVVVWNEKVDEIESIVNDQAELQIVNARLKDAIGEGLELHVDSLTCVEQVSKQEESVKIAKLREGQNSGVLQAEVRDDPYVKEASSSQGEVLRLAVLELSDETGRIWVLARQQHVEGVCNLKKGDKIAIKNPCARRGFSGRLEILLQEKSLIPVQ